MNIKAVYNAIDAELALVNNKLLSIASSKHSLVSDVVSHIIANGKRVRPALVILMAKAFGVKNLDSIVNSAFAIEMIHTASLLHDDVVDGTKKRRGKKTANILWGNKEVILVGDHLFTQAFLAISALQNNDAVNIIANASHNLTVGEIIQLQNEQNIRITFEDYLEVIYNKTA
jgi:octaprenyl-diphosphate synthase